MPSVEELEGVEELEMTDGVVVPLVAIPVVL